MGYTTAELLNKVKLWAAVPTGQPAFTDAEMLQIMTDEMYSNIVPFIMSMQEEYFIKYKDHTIVAGTNEYSIPTKAMGNILRDVIIVDGDNFIEVGRISLSAMGKHQTGMYINGNNIYLMNPSDYAGKTLRMYYYYRPNELVTTANTTNPVRASSSVSGNVVTLGTMPTTWTNSTKLDLIKHKPPFTIYSDEVTGTISGLTITFSSLPSDFEAGDYVCTTNYSPVANIPLECQNLLCQACVLKMMEALSDSAGLKLVTTKYNEMKMNVEKLITPRITGKLKKLVQYDSFLNREYLTYG